MDAETATTVTLLATLAGILLTIAYLWILAIRQVRRQRVKGFTKERRCARCGGALLPLLDGAHVFRGEAVCNRGHWTQGIPWLPKVGQAQRVR